METLESCSTCGTELARSGYKDMFVACPKCSPSFGHDMTQLFGLFTWKDQPAKPQPHSSTLKYGSPEYWLAKVVEEEWSLEKMKAEIRRYKAEVTAARYGQEVKKRASKPISRTRPTNAKVRRDRSDIQTICDAMYRVLEAERPMTVRQVFYRMVGQGVIGKSEKEYKSTVCRLLTRMRRRKELPYKWIADNTRWVRQPNTYSSAEEALRETARTYRRSLWDNQDAYVEIWLEKDALSGVIYDVTSKYDVPLMVVRGFSSLSFLYDAAETIAEMDKPTYLYYFGDYDPSGLMIPKTVERDLRELAPEADITFERIAVTPEQIASMNLPTRPTKTKGTHAQSFKGESVEVDTIPPPVLRSIVENCITQHIDESALEITKAAEQSERAALLDWRLNWTANTANEEFLG